MPQVPAEKSYFTFAKGLNTDASKINFPEESTSDETNYELLKDGSRRRRRGLAQEEDGVAKTLTNTLGLSDTVSSIKWPNAGGTGVNYIVVQAGAILMLYEDSITPSSNIVASEVNMEQFLVSGKAITDIETNHVSMDVGHHNRLLVAGRYIEPFYVDFDGSVLSATQIRIYERDFVGVNDDINIISRPTTTTAAHTYNLRVRGWKQVDIDQYETDKSEYPSKNMWPWKGYRRVNVTGVAEEDGTWEFASDKAETELFGTTTAPLGHLVVTIWDTTTTGIISTPPVIEAWTDNWDNVQITSTAHGLSNGNTVTITGNEFLYEGTFGSVYSDSLNGVWVIDAVAANTFEITKSIPFDYITLLSTVTLGTYYSSTFSSEVVTNPDPFITDERPTIVKWFAGRAWWMGVQDQALKDKVYFSQIVENEIQYGKCYQAADPTDTIFNSLVASDGGFLLIPDINVVIGAKIFNNVLLIFTDIGIWQISGGNGGFAADNYQVRKIADVSATSKWSIVSSSDNIYWTGHDGIYHLFQDPQTGYLTVQSISDDKVSTLWNTIPSSDQARVKAEFDKSLTRVYFMYRSQGYAASYRYDVCLVYSIKQQAFYKLTFPSSTTQYIIDMFSITSTEEGENNKNIKFMVTSSSGTTFTLCDMDQDNFVDFDSGEILPYLVTGYDNLQDFHRYKQAPVLHVFMQKTETGYTEDGTDLIPINESSALMRPIWDWSDHANSGKFGPQQQVYRHRRYYQPASVADGFDDGQPVLVTRNKLRGRGRVLHLRFDGETAKDSHILGWSIQYLANRKV